MPVRDDAAISAERERLRMANIKKNAKSAKTQLTSSNQDDLGYANTRGGSQLGSGDNKTART